jgi:type II secretory pathway predicted ATPase ExeA
MKISSIFIDELTLLVQAQCEVVESDQNASSELIAAVATALAGSIVRLVRNGKDYQVKIAEEAHQVVIKLIEKKWRLNEQG